MAISKGTDYVLKVKKSSSGGARSSTVGSGTALPTGRARIRFQMVSLVFATDIVLPTAL